MLRAEIAAFTDRAHHRRGRCTWRVNGGSRSRRSGNGETMPGFAPFVERGVFVEHPDGTMVQPRVPYRLSGAPTRPFGPVAPLGADTEALRSDAPHARVTRDGPRRRNRRRRPAARGPAGLRLHVVLGRTVRGADPRLPGRRRGEGRVGAAPGRHPHGHRVLVGGGPAVGARAPVPRREHQQARGDPRLHPARGPRARRAGCWPRATS